MSQNCRPWRHEAVAMMLDSQAKADNSAGKTTAEPSRMAERDWQVLTGLRTDATNFPVRASLGGEGIVVFRTKTGFRGVQRACPHMQATMMSAQLAGNETMIRCSLHAFTFKLADGRGVNCPGFWLKVYEIKEENGTFYGRCVATAA
jgi:nitrite reductase/ring-hydroxylating ferredoxin subunit